MSQEITAHIKEQIAQKSYCRDGEWYIRIGNCRLDFSKEYKIVAFTKKVVKLAWKNGTEWIPVQAKVEDRGEHYSLYTESWSFIEHLKKENQMEVSQ